MALVFAGLTFKKSDESLWINASVFKETQGGGVGFARAALRGGICNDSRRCRETFCGEARSEEENWLTLRSEGAKNGNGWLEKERDR
jgi:hypothetical protein